MSNLSSDTHLSTITDAAFTYDVLSISDAASSYDAMSSLSNAMVQSTISDADSAYKVCVLHFGGASQGNPGKSGAGAVLMTEDRRLISQLREGLGVATNNVAGYQGLILGLKYAIRHGFKRIKVYGDSLLVCNQVRGTWISQNQKMMELCNEVRGLQANFISFVINHVQRAWNAAADREANMALTLPSGTVIEDRVGGF